MARRAELETQGGFVLSSAAPQVLTEFDGLHIQADGAPVSSIGHCPHSGNREASDYPANLKVAVKQLPHSPLSRPFTPIHLASG